MDLSRRDVEPAAALAVAALPPPLPPSPRRGRERRSCCRCSSLLCFGARWIASVSQRRAGPSARPDRAQREALVRHRQPRHRPTHDAPLRRAGVAQDRPRGRVDLDGDRHHRRVDRRLLRQGVGPVADAGHRPVPRGAVRSPCWPSRCKKFGQTVNWIIIVLAALGWMYVARIVRGQVLSIKEKEFVEAARASGRLEPPHHRPPHPAELHRADPGERDAGHRRGDHHRVDAVVPRVRHPDPRRVVGSHAVVGRGQLRDQHAPAVLPRPA